MAFNYYPFDAGPGATVKKAQWAAMARHWRTNGVIVKNTIMDGTGASDDFAGKTSTGLSVTIGTGVAWVDGHYFENTAPYTVSLAAADATNPRKDLIVIRLDRSANSITIDKVTGTPAPSPAVPTPTQNATVFELPIYEVTVSANATSLTTSDLSDRRQMSVHQSIVPMCIAKMATTGTVAAGQTVTLKWDGTDEVDTMWMHYESDNTINSNIYIRDSGIYVISVAVPVNTAECALSLYKNNTSNKLARVGIGEVPNTFAHAYIHRVASLVRGDYLFCQLKNENTGSTTLTYSTDGDMPYFSVMKVAESNVVWY
jgi:hypothetical protein